MAAFHKVEVSLNANAVEVGIPSPQTVNVVVPLVGPQGPAGATGATGAVGPQGPQGPAGTGLETLTTQGDTLYRGASTGERLPIGTAGQVLKVVNGLPAWANESGAVSSVNGETGAVVLDGSEIDTSGNDASAAFIATSFGDGDGIYYPLPDSFINTKPVYRTTSGYSVFFENSRWHITDGSPVTANIIESSDNDNAAWPWLSAWSADVTKAKLSDVVGRARDTFLFVGDSIPNTSVSGLASVAASGDYDDLSGKPTIPTASSATPSALGTAAAGSSNDFARADHVHAMPSASDVGAAASTHASTHHTGGTDALAAHQINGQTIFGTGSPTYSTDQTLGAARALQLTVSNTNASGINLTLPVQSDGTLNGDTYVIIGGSAVSGPITVRRINLLSPLIYQTLATITSTGQQYRFRASGGQTGGWTLVPVDTHTHPSTQITGLGTAATQDSTAFAAASHTHAAADITSGSFGNISFDGKLGSTAGLPVVTTTAGAVTTLALGTAGQILRTKSDLSGVEFADPAAAGVTSVTGTAPIVSSGGTTPAISVTVGTGANTVAAGDDSRFHTRSHAITSTSDHTAGNHKVFYSDGSGQIQELALGSSGQVLTSNGATSAPSFAAASGGVTTGSVDNAVLRADGTGGSTSQSSDLVIDDFTSSTQRNVAVRVEKSRFSITADAGTDVITATGSTGVFTANDPVVFPVLTGGAGLSTLARYFVRDISGDTFKVSTSSGGAAVNITTNYTGGTVELQTALVLSGSHMGGIIAGPRPDGTALGGNARGARSVVDLQQWRTAATQVASGDYSVICGGISNTASGSNSFIGTGDANLASAYLSVVLGSRNNTASGQSAFVVGESCTASAENAIALVNNSVADRNSIIAHAAGRFGASGDAQHINAVLRATTTTNSAVELFMGVNANVRLTIPSGKVMFANIKIVGVSNGGGTVATFERQYALKNVGGTVSEIYAPVTIGTDNAASTSITVDANDTNDALRIQCTGLSATTIRWVAHVSAVEVTHG